MRYTFRLLTAQQFQRAAALICACDKIRKENEEELGASRITIGFGLVLIQLQTEETKQEKHFR